MAFNTPVNSQNTDSVSEGNNQIVANAADTSISNLYLATSQALAHAAHNATLAQQQTNIIAQAATAQGVALLYSLNGANTGKTASSLLNPSE